jgi:hypothetical protein
VKVVKGIYVVIRIGFFAWCWAIAGFIIVLQMARALSPIVIVYDVTLMLYFFIIPRLWEHKKGVKFDNIDEVYKFIGTIVFGCFGYYIMEYVYQL